MKSLYFKNYIAIYLVNTKLKQSKYALPINEL